MFSVGGKMGIFHSLSHKGPQLQQHGFTAQHRAEDCFQALLNLTCLISLTAHCFPLILTVWLPFTSIQIHLPNPSSLPLTATTASRTEEERERQRVLYFFSLFLCGCLIALRQINSGGSLTAAASLKPSTWLQVWTKWGSVSVAEEFHRLWCLPLSVSTPVCLTWF